MTRQMEKLEKKKKSNRDGTESFTLVNMNEILKVYKQDYKNK